MLMVMTMLTVLMLMMIMGLMMAIRKKGLEGGHPSKHKPLTHYLSFKVMMVMVIVINVQLGLMSWSIFESRPDCTVLENS